MWYVGEFSGQVCCKVGLHLTQFRCRRVSLPYITAGIEEMETIEAGVPPSDIQMATASREDAFMEILFDFDMMVEDEAQVVEAQLVPTSVPSKDWSLEDILS